MKRILCYGDSNTWGHDPEPEEENFRYGDDVRWTGVLQKCLLGRAKIIEEGLCGRTIMFDDPTSPDRNGRKFLGCSLQSHQPLDLVVLMLGTNDVRHIFTPSVKEIAAGMANLVRMVRNPDTYWVGKRPEVLVIVPAPVRDEIAESDFYGMYDEESVRKSKALYAAYEAALKGMDGVRLLDAGKTAEVSVKDCIHLTGEGHRNLGTAAAKCIEEILKI